MSWRECHGMARTPHVGRPLAWKNPSTMTMAAVGGRDAGSTDRPPDPPRFSRRWCSRVLADFRRERARFGLRSTLREFAFRSIHHVVSFRVLRGIYLAAADARFTECPPGFTGDFLSRETLQRVSLDRRYDLPPEFVSEALGRGDACYGVLDGDRVASYGWYTHAPTKISDDLWLHFDQAYVYRYKGLTLEPYRGRRFHAITMVRAGKRGGQASTLQGSRLPGVFNPFASPVSAPPASRNIQDSRRRRASTRARSAQRLRFPRAPPDGRTAVIEGSRP